MKLHVLSDLHVEFAHLEPPATDCDVVVLAGDIGVGIGALDWVHDQFTDMPIIYVMGNHEYYGHDFNLKTEFQRRARENIHILDNEFVIINGVRFLGSTLWTDFALFGEGEQFFATQFAEQGMADFEVIRQGGKRFTPQMSIEAHRRSREWLFEVLAAPFDGATVVVTHHAPSLMSVAPRFKTDQMSPAFASRLEPLIETHKPNLWIHGHTHDAFDYEIYDTRVVCNPRGYPEEAGLFGFNPGLVVEV